MFVQYDGMNIRVKIILEEENKTKLCFQRLKCILSWYCMHNLSIQSVLWVIEVWNWPFFAFSHILHIWGESHLGYIMGPYLAEGLCIMYPCSLKVKQRHYFIMQKQHVYGFSLVRVNINMFSTNAHSIQGSQNTIGSLVHFIQRNRTYSLNFHLPQCFRPSLKYRKMFMGVGSWNC